MSTTKVITVYLSNPEHAQSEFWKQLEMSIPLNWSFKYENYKNAIEENIYEQCIFFDLSYEEISKILFFQRAYALPFIYISSETKPQQEIKNILKLGATDVFCCPLNGAEIAAKLTFLFANERKIYNESFDQIPLTKIEEDILYFIIKKPFRTTAKNISHSVWKGQGVQMKTFNVHISKLRKKLRSIDLDIKYLSDRSYHVIKKKTLSQHVDLSSAI